MPEFCDGISITEHEAYNSDSKDVAYQRTRA